MASVAHQASASWIAARVASAAKMKPGSATDSMVRAPLSADDGRRESGPVRIRCPRPTATVALLAIISPIPTFGLRWTLQLRKANVEKILRPGHLAVDHVPTGTGSTPGDARSRSMPVLGPVPGLVIGLGPAQLNEWTRVVGGRFAPVLPALIGALAQRLDEIEHIAGAIERAAFVDAW